MPQPTIRFDFSYYIPNFSTTTGVVPLTERQCILNDFVLTVEAGDLIPGNKYLIEYKLLNPQTNPGNPENIFNPETQTIYASFTTQKFSTVINLESQGEYILQADITDISLGPNSNFKASSIINLKCGEKPQPSVTPTLTPTVTPSSFYRENLFSVNIPNPTIGTNDPEVINIYDCDIEFPLIAFVDDAIVGAKYEYSFYDNPRGAVYFENKIGSFHAGSDRQNFNTKIALTGYPYVWIYADVKHKNSGFVKSSKPVLFKCYQSNECDVILPSGINIEYGARALKTCAAMGITQDSIKQFNGGTNFKVGDQIALDGTGAYPPPLLEVSRIGLDESSFESFGGGSGICIGDKFSAGSGSLFEISSGGLTNSSILSFNNCYGFSIGDLVTTSGGGGLDAVIRITATGTNGSVTGWNVLNPGHGYTGLPQNIIPINGPPNCGCASVTFKTCEFTVPNAGGITKESIDVYGGNGYKCGDILSLEGGFPPAKLLVDSWGLTRQSISGIIGGDCYQVGDYLTTVGGEGKDVLIRVSQVNTSGSITSWELLHGGHGFCSSPTGLINLSDSNCNTAELVSLPLGTAGGEITRTKGFTTDALPCFTGVVYRRSNNTILTENAVIQLRSSTGSGAAVVITKVDSDNKVVSWGIIDQGYGYGTETPVLLDDNNQQIIPQLSCWRSGNLTKDSVIITDDGGGYNNPDSTRNRVVSDTGSGSGVNINYDGDELTDLPITVINPGSTSVPPGFGPITTVTGSGAPPTGTFTDSGTIPCAGGITYESINNIIGNGPNHFVGQRFNISSAEGSGGVIEVIATSGSGYIRNYVVLNAGCYYGCDNPITISPVSGPTLSNPNIDCNDFTDPPFDIVDPGWDVTSEATGIIIKTGNGQNTPDNPILVITDNALEPRDGPAPSPSPTPTVTPTVTPSLPALCNDIQSAGLQNEILSVRVAENAIAGSNYLVVEDNRSLLQYTVLSGNGIQLGTSITKIENWFANFDNRVLYKKITLDKTITANINQNTILPSYIVDMRYIKTQYWVGTMEFKFTTYSIPDRFRVIAVHADSRIGETILYDSGYRGVASRTPCGPITASDLSGPPTGEITLVKPEGVVEIKVTVEAPCPGTAWQYLLGCPVRTDIFATPTPTTTVTNTVSLSPTVTPTYTSTITPTPSRSRT
jgi:hypothetical protein